MNNNGQLNEPSTATMFELTDIHGRITLDNVYLNGLHALKRLEIRNLSDQSILIKMRSNLRNQIAFQLENENISNLPINPDLVNYTTNTVSWSREAEQYPFNQLFNYVNHIDQIDLEPGQARSFILAFLPEQQEDLPLDDATETYTTFNVTGSLFFFGYYQQNEQHVFDDNTSTLADYQVSVKFRASVCQSALWSDVAETGLNFDDCVLGETYIKDIIIQNRSEIDLHWLLNTTDIANLDWLQFLDADTGLPLSHDPIPSFASKQIRLLFMPKEVGEYNYDLQLENINDARNVVQTKVHANARSVLRKETLLVSSGNVVDFGDCISGSWAVQQIVLNNVSESPVEVKFLPEGAEVIFDIKQDTTVNDTESARVNSMRRKFSNRTNTTGFNTPATELSGPNSEFSSRSTSPTLNHSPTLTEGRIPTIPEDSDSDIGLGLASIEGSVFTESSSSVGESIVTLANSSVAPVPLGPAESYTRIEDFVLKPGTERVIQVSYRPQKDLSINDFNAGQLIRRNFRIMLEYSTFRSEEPKERKVIQCRARTCTSFVEVIPKVIHFGDTDVGTLKSLPINIFNRSDILARVELQFSSKVLNCLRGEITIQPRSYVELKLDLYPRKVNPDYRKQITLVNFLNRDNDQIIEVHSTNIDKNRVTFHSLFYRILTATGANFLDFGSIALNSPSLRTFTVENIRDKPLQLEITTSLPEDIVIYTRNKKKELPQPDPVVLSSTVAPTSSKLAHSITADTVKHTDTITDLPTNNTITNNHASRRRSKLLLESISNRRISKQVSTNDTAKSSVDKDTVKSRRISDVKKDMMRSRNKIDKDTAYLDLALPPLHSLKSYKRKMIPVHADHTFLKHHLKKKDKASTSTTECKKEAVNGNSSSSSNKTNKHKTTKEHRIKKPATTSKTKHNYSKAKRSMGITAARYKSRKNLDWSDIAGKSRVPFEDLISVLEHGSKAAPPLFPKQAAEEQFVRYQIAWRRELDRLVEKGILVRTSVVDVDPKGEEEVVIVITPSGATKPHVQSAPKKQDARIFLRLLQFDRDIEQTEFENLLDLSHEDIPVREVILRSQLCRSVMDLGQKNINFGLVERNERHAKSIVLHNRSETPLLYAIRKSGSIASGDIDLDVGRYGVVRSYGKREVEFIFEPTLPGPFMEKLIIENIRDRTNDQVLLLKAQVRKPSTFLIKSLEMSFGRCLIDQSCQKVETIVLTNTNKQSRMFEIRVDPNEMTANGYYVEFDFDVKEDDTNTLSKEAEEEIENLEQKLKIAKRKAQPDKVKKYLRKLAKLKNLDESSASSSSTTTNSSAKESNVVFKKTAESVVFPLDAHATKTISVIFKPMSKPFQETDQQPLDPTVPISVKGRILVHEYKNTDVTKSIVYTADVYTNEAVYIDALAIENDGENTGAASTRADLANAENNTTMASEKAVVEEAIQLERNFFDGGRVEVNQKAMFYVKLTNVSDEPVDFEFVDTEDPSVFDFSKDTQLLPNETKKVPYGIQLSRVGKQQHSFNLKNKRSGSIQTYTIQLLVHCSTYLDFPSLSDEAHGVLDLGYSYVDPGSKYSQVTPLLVENTSDQDIFITCQSNLSHQVLIFMDEAGERGLVEMMPLKRGGMTTVWVAVQPNLLTGYLGNSADECRELVGGIKFSVFEKDDLAQEDVSLMLTHTVKFTSVIGQSHLEVSDRVINLGYTDLLQREFYGAFTIKNKSGELPLDYEVECASGNIELDRKGGTLHGWLGNKPRRDTDMEYLDKSKRALNLSESDLTRRDSYDEFASVVPASLTQITFRINAYRYVLLNEKLVVTNKRNSQEVFIIEVRLFVDSKKLDAWYLPSKKMLRSVLAQQNEYDDQTEHREADPLPMIKWESLYISPVPQKSDGKTLLKLIELPESDMARLHVREIDVANTSGQPMQLVVMSDVDITAGFAVDEDKIKSVSVKHKAGLFLQRSGQVSLQPGQRIRVRLHSPSALKLNEEGRELALHGKSGSLKGMMVLHDARQDLEILALELEALFCVSHIDLDTKRIDLGKIGHSTSYKPVRFEFQLENLADVPATYEIQAPKFFNFTPLDRNGVAVKQKSFYIPSRKTQRIEGLLMPKEIPDQTSGVQQFDIRIDNIRNHANKMHLHLKALMTVFELRFERLASNGELVLPVLNHPITLQNATCDNWFVIHNKTDDDLRFEIGADILPDLSPYVNLDVLSRYTNSPLKGDIAIGPQGSIEVRVRASPNETSRLPRNRPEFTDPAGIIMANLWVTTRAVEEDEDVTRVRETIPVRCILKEAPTFSLSERKLEFKLLTYYQDDEGSSNIADSACMPESNPLTIINHAVKVPLRCKVSVEGPAEFPAHEIVMISGLDKDHTGVVEPGGSLELSVAIPNPKESMPGQLKIHVDDLDALGESRQTVSVFVTEIVWDL